MFMARSTCSAVRPLRILTFLNTLSAGIDARGPRSPRITFTRLSRSVANVSIGIAIMPMPPPGGRFPGPPGGPPGPPGACARRFVISVTLVMANSAVASRPTRIRRIELLLLRPHAAEPRTMGRNPEGRHGPGDEGGRIAYQRVAGSGRTTSVLADDRAVHDDPGRGELGSARACD